MSAPIDVLAVMERASIDELPLMSAVDMKEARSAVAELIEKVDELLSTHGEYRGYGGAGEAIEERMRAELVLALARVKGGAA
ncbi:hypothetical protein ACYPJF_07655 [Stenotrophomonas geniculata]|uniref:hypothetical protein n=1 Tax=Stenotrophomonas maltophilia TaxID=40324 RepID=UPI000C26A7FF|nr:hypothetical protein [Stenotrophomonas maltophilia]PJL51464.1 hypothetical protein B9Y74_05565 [Stenotrophomonas maltophilia]